MENKVFVRLSLAGRLKFDQPMGIGTAGIIIDDEHNIELEEKEKKNEKWQAYANDLTI